MVWSIIGVAELPIALIMDASISKTAINVMHKRYILRYTTVGSKISSGVCINLSRYGEKIMPTTVMPIPSAMATLYDAWYIFFFLSLSPAPYALANSILTPIARPEKRPMAIVIIRLLAPIAAEPFLPMVCPTIIRSAELYACWIKYAIMRGSTNLIIFLLSGPSVNNISPLLIIISIKRCVQKPVKHHFYSQILIALLYAL